MQYTIHGVGDNRVLEVKAEASLRYKFKQVINGEWAPVAFKRAGNKLLAVVSDTVSVYRLPNAQQFHYEYMAQNARSLWLAVPMEHDRLVENMLEFVEFI